ncbi:hypothetical protein quinque_005753 [Culex quinquefasciatus]
MLITSVLLIALQSTIVLSSSLSRCSVQFSEDSSSGVGVLNTTFNNVSYCEYLGVRYGEAGRFQDSSVYTPKGLENYTKYRSVCAQLDDMNRPIVVIGEEDCFFVNIFSPEIKFREDGTRKLLPVLVFIHGGGFTIGSASFDVAGVDLLMEQEIVVISINYRLDVLGFLHYPKLNITGNYGLKDQQTALRWINRYIESFGGDPSKLTLMGQSAGAASVNYHMYSDQSRGLFQQAALLSGSFLAPWAFSHDPEPRVEKYFEYLGLTEPTREDLLNRDFQQFFFLNDTSRWLAVVFNTIAFPWFVPTTDSSSDPNPFMTLTPYEMLVRKPILDVPLLVGHTLTEFELHLGYVKFYYSDFASYPNGKNETLTVMLDAIVHAMANYSADMGITRDRSEFFQKLGNIADMVFPVEYFLEKVIDRGQTAPIFVYRFDFDGKFGMYKHDMFKNAMKNASYGAIHGDDLGYIFTPYNAREALKRRDDFKEEWKIHREMVELVSNFVKNGNPSSSELKWNSYNKQMNNNNYLKIAETFNMENGPMSDPLYYDFWKTLHDCLYYFECSTIQETLNTIS